MTKRRTVCSLLLPDLLLQDERGTATIEYLIVLVAVTIGAAFALMAIGPSLIELFRVRVLWLSLPVP